MEKYRQMVLPEDDFAGIAVEQHILENPDAPEHSHDALKESARMLEHGGYRDDAMDRVRGFLTGMIGFGKQESQDKIRRMNRPTRSGK